MGGDAMSDGAPFSLKRDGALLLPAAAVLAGLFIGPMLYFLVVSFFKVSLFKIVPGFDLGNYAKVVGSYGPPILFTMGIGFLIASVTTVLAFIVAHLIWTRGRRFSGILLLLAQLIAFILSERIMSFSETLAFNDKVVYSTSTPYQRIVITKSKRDLRLYLNNNLQFSSADEYRYHEALVHPAMTAAGNPRHVLVLGGGDGLAVREILKYPSVESVQLVDLDPAMTRLFSSQQILQQINKHSLQNNKVTVSNADAFTWLKNHRQQKFDCVIVDFPDPSGFSIGKLYTTAFYRLLQTVLQPGAAVVIQCTSPYVAPKSFWSINTTLMACGFRTVPYHNYVPSFGEWGYIMALDRDNYRVPDTFAVQAKYISKPVMEQMLQFPEDMKAHTALEVNKLNNQALVHYFEEEWGKYLEQ